MYNPPKFNKRKLRHLLVNFRDTTRSYNFQLTRLNKNSYDDVDTHYENMERIESLIDEIDQYPWLPIGEVFQKLMELVHPLSPFKKDMLNSYKHFLSHEEIQHENFDSKRPLNKPNQKRKRDDDDSDE